MQRCVLLVIIVLLFVVEANGRGSGQVVVDSATGQPLPGASVFDSRGKFVGVSSSRGVLPSLQESDYPVLIRYIGFHEKEVPSAMADTVALQENIMELPEVVVESRQQRLLHILAYVREYSTMSTYTDTIFLFREKMVDFMLPKDDKVNFEGWNTPRVLVSKSYYHFTDAFGLDSVSDNCNNHFSWSDWIGIIPSAEVPHRLALSELATDTVMGKYSPSEIWTRKKDNLTLDVNVLADTTGRKWVPNLSYFFRDNVDFEQFRLSLNYANAGSNILLPIDLSGYSFNIESNGRGRGMFMFNRSDEDFYVSTYAEVYIADKEFITVKEAKKWRKFKSNGLDIAMYEPPGVPGLHSSILGLIDRVDSIDTDETRLLRTPDKRLAGRKIEKLNVGAQILKRVKGLIGIDSMIGERKRSKRWEEFRDGRKKRNRLKSNEE